MIKIIFCIDNIYTLFVDIYVALIQKKGDMIAAIYNKISLLFVGFTLGS